MGILSEGNLSPLWLSLRVSLLASFFAIFTGILLAKRCMKLSRTKRAILEGLFTLPLVLPPTATGFFLLVLTGLRIDLHTWSISVDVEGMKGLGGYVAAAAVIAFPFMYRCASNAFSQVNENMLDVGRTLGMSEWKIFWNVLLPASRGGILKGMILTFLRSTGEYGAALIVAEQVLGKKQTVAFEIASDVPSGHLPAAAYWSVGLGVAFWIILALVNMITGHGMKKERGI